MSNPVQEFELSALIDGELDPARAAEIRSAIAADPVLRAQYEYFAKADRAWAAAAASARFRPALPRDASAAPASRAQLLMTAMLVVILTAGRLVLKIVPLELVVGVFIHALMLAAAIAATVRISQRATASIDPP